MKPWTNKEKRYLLDHHKEKSTEELAEILGRTKYAVQQKKSALRLVRAYKNSSAIYEVTRGYEVLATGTADECAEILGMKRQTIYFYASESHTRRIKDLDKAIVAMRIE